MNGALLCIALLVYGLAWLAFYGADHRAEPDKKHAWERVGAALAAVATFGALLSVDGVFAQTWAAAGTGVGLFILVVVLATAGAFGYFAIVRGFKHNRHSTLALGIVLGGAMALALGDWQAIRSNTGQYLATAGHGITGAAAGKAGSGAHGHAASGGMWGIVLLLAAAVILGWIIVRKHRRGEVITVARPRSGGALPVGGARPLTGGGRSGSGRGGATAPLFAGGDS